MNEDYVAFHEICTLLGWRDSSSGAGHKIIIGLPSRASLEHFDTATRRRGKKAGQRYHAALSDLDGNSILGGRIDLWFAGANWAHQDGARVVFTVDDDGLEFVKTLTPKDSGVGTPSVFYLTLVQIDEDETPINQRKADIVERAIDNSAPPGTMLVIDEAAPISEKVWKNLTHGEFPVERPAEPEKPKGGPRSKQVAMLCQDQLFQVYVAKQTNGLSSNLDFAAADAYVKAQCGIRSKVELDHNEATWETFIAKVRRPFLEWAHVAQTA